MHKVVFPGWAVPLEHYIPYNPDDILDFGFFTAESRDYATNAIEIDLGELSDMFLEKMLSEKDSVIIAHSLGALPALRCSQISGRIRACVIIGGFARFTQCEDYPSGKPEKELAAMRNFMKLAPGMVLKKFYDAMCAPSECRITAEGKMDAARLTTGLQYLAETDLRQSLKDINIPVLILHGDSDRIVSPELACYPHENIPGSQLHIIRDAGHALPFTHFNECMKYIDGLKL